MPFAHLSGQRREAALNRGRLQRLGYRKNGTAVARAEAEDQQAHIQCLVDGLPKDLTERQRKLTEDCEKSFRDLQRRLTTPPILVAPRDEGEYVLDTDASDHALGAVLHQKQDGHLKVIAYASRSLTAPERRYCITRREILGVVFGLRKFRQHLLGRRVMVRTDHSALTSH